MYDVVKGSEESTVHIEQAPTDASDPLARHWISIARSAVGVVAADSCYVHGRE